MTCHTTESARKTRSTTDEEEDTTPDQPPHSAQQAAKLNQSHCGAAIYKRKDRKKHKTIRRSFRMATLLQVPSLHPRFCWLSISLSLSCPVAQHQPFKTPSNQQDSWNVHKSIAYINPIKLPASKMGHRSCLWDEDVADDGDTLAPLRLVCCMHHFS